MFDLAGPRMMELEAIVDPQVAEETSLVLFAQYLSWLE